MAILIYALALLLALPGLLLLVVALVAKQEMVDLVAGKGDYLPGTNPTPLRDRLLVGGIGLGLTAVALLFVLGQALS